MRRDILAGAFRRYRPPALKFFIKIITRGLRIGLMGRMVEEAVAVAEGIPAEGVRDANNRLGDLAQVALAARQGSLQSITARLFHPMDFMLAKPLDRLADLAEPAAWIAEDKYDGIRSQLHFDSGHVKLFSRGMEDVSHVFPEITAAAVRLRGSGLLDGEILAWRDGRPLNFNLLQQRLARKNISQTLLADIPVLFVAYDLLFIDGRLLLDDAIENRRASMAERLADGSPQLLVSTQHAPEAHADIERLFNEARARGNEGLVLKRRGSRYEPGKRSGMWQKFKRPYATLDVVVTAAEQGSGRRSIHFSDYTFAVRSGTSFLNVGKAYSGLTDVEVRELTRLLRSLSTDRFGSTIVVQPAVVLEVAFDGVSKSSRHKSGYALRFPRIVRWRRDKKPEDSDDLARVEALYQASVR